MIRPNVPGRSISTISEEGSNTVTTAVVTLGAGLACVRLRVPAQVPAATEMMLFRIPGATNATVAKTVAVSAAKQTRNHPPVIVTIVTQALHVRSPAHSLLWTMTVSWMWGNARKLRRNTTLGWRGRRTSGSQPRSEGGLRLSTIGISGISRNHPRMAFGSKVRGGQLPFSWSDHHGN